MFKRISKVIIIALLVAASYAPSSFVLPNDALAADPVIQFQRESANASPIFDLPGTYDYAPTAISEGGLVKTWYCGGYADSSAIGDAIYYAAITTSGQPATNPTPVITPQGSRNYAAEDSQHACAPTVIKKSHPDIYFGEELYLMYYECARKFFMRPNLNPVEGFTQICLAYSHDGVNWMKYNENLWNSSNTFGDSSTDPTPVLKVPQQILNNTQYQFQNGLQTLGTGLGAYDYGVGHPSAMVVNVSGTPEIWVYYWNSAGDPSQQGTYLAKSNDGFHFYSNSWVPLSAVANVVYYPGTIGSRTGVFIAAVTADSNAFAYSFNGVNWVRAQSASDWTTKYFIGNATTDRCTTPSVGTFITDKLGILNSLSHVQFLSGEGFLGSFDQGQQRGCYSSTEDSVGRGATWALYYLTGSFIDGSAPTPVPGDLNSDHIVNSIDWSIMNSKWFTTDANADLNHDGIVNAIDYSILNANWFKTW